MDIFLFATSAIAHRYFFLKKRQDHMEDSSALQRALQEGTSLNAQERIALVTPDNQIIEGGGLRKDMRLRKLWHRATYVLVRHEPTNLLQHSEHNLSNVHVIVQRRSKNKDYCPGKLDPTPGGVVGHNETYRENAIREMEEELGIKVDDSLKRLFTFKYQDDHVKVWGDFYECIYTGTMAELRLQPEEVDSVHRFSLAQLQDMLEREPEQIMPDSRHALRLYFQRIQDLQVNRKLLPGYSSSNLEDYQERPRPEVIFFDCDDCLYFDNWKTASLLTKKIDEWCTNHGLKPGQAYELYKEYGTALRGLLAEGYMENTEEAIDSYLADVHDIPIDDLIKEDQKLREIISGLDPSIPRYIFTASVSHHAKRCIRALGIQDLFQETIIDSKMCGLETKHSHHSFRVAMETAGVKDPERCLFLDDSVKNIRTANEIGWRAVLVGKVSRDQGIPISSEHAELEIEHIHEIRRVLSDIFV